VEGSLEFTRQADPSELPALRFFLMRHFPSIEDPSKPAVHEIVSSVVSDVKVADIWAGKAAVTFMDSAVEEVADMGPVKPLSGFYHSIGLTITGGRVLYRY
jgi:acetoacetate decarboxylase